MAGFVRCVRERSGTGLGGLVLQFLALVGKVVDETAG
jgi:hypothetical protein